MHTLSYVSVPLTVPSDPLKAIWDQWPDKFILWNVPGMALIGGLPAMAFLGRDVTTFLTANQRKGINASYIVVNAVTTDGHVFKMLPFSAKGESEVVEYLTELLGLEVVVIRTITPDSGEGKGVSS